MCQDNIIIGALKVAFIALHLHIVCLYLLWLFAMKFTASELYRSIFILCMNWSHLPAALESDSRTNVVFIGPSRHLLRCLQMKRIC